MALVERCRRGELGAFEEIYRAHSGRLYGLVLRMVGNQSDAEDLLQDVFLAAHRKLDGFRGESALGTWLYRLATNQCLDYLRSRAARTGQLTDTMDNEPEMPDARSARTASIVSSMASASGTVTQCTTQADESRSRSAATRA